MKNFFKTLGKFTLPALAALATSLVACSGSTEFENAGGTSDEAEGIIAISNKTIAGVSQKGPFVTGSRVVLKETRGNKLTPTGKEYLATIRNDKGEFKIDNINLESQFVLLSATGYYEREATDQMSTCEITLNAAVNINNRDNVNINILTHLENDRILHLVKNGKSFSNARNQAHTELMKVFGLQDLLTDNSENLDMTGSSVNDSILRYISWLFDRLDSSNDDERDNEEFCKDYQKFFDNLATEFSSKGKISNNSLSVFLNDVFDRLAYDEDNSMSEAFIKARLGLDDCTEKNNKKTVSLESLFGTDVYNPDKADSIPAAYMVCHDGSWISLNINEYNEFLITIKHQTDSMTDPRDSSIYKTISFTTNGKKYTWMAEDLHYKNYKDNSSYIRTTALDISSDFKEGPIDTNLISLFHQGICPTGWHLPQSSEWNELIRYVGNIKYLTDEYINKIDFYGDFNHNYIGIPQNKDLWTIDIFSNPSDIELWDEVNLPYQENMDFIEIKLHGIVSLASTSRVYVRCVKNY